MTVNFLFHKCQQAKSIVETGIFTFEFFSVEFNVDFSIPRFRFDFVWTFAPIFRLHKFVFWSQAQASFQGSPVMMTTSIKKQRRIKILVLKITAYIVDSKNWR